jgi:hypothetical protein
MSFNEILGYLCISAAVIVAFIFWLKPKTTELKEFFGFDNWEHLVEVFLLFIASISIWVYVLFFVFDGGGRDINPILINVLNVASLVYVFIFLCWWILNIFDFFSRNEFLLKFNKELSFFVRIIPLLVAIGFFISFWIVILIKAVGWFVQLIL